MNIFIIIIEQGYLTIKYKKAYDWLEEDEQSQNPEDVSNINMPKELKIGSGNQQAFEKEMFSKLRDAFEGITDGNIYGKGEPIDNHPMPS